MKVLYFNIALLIIPFLGNTCNGQELEMKKHPFFVNTSLSPIFNENFFVSPSFSFGIGIVKKDQHYLGINYSRYNLQGLANLSSFYYDARIGTHNPLANYHGYSSTFDMHLLYRCVSTGLFYAKLHHLNSRKALFYTSLNIMAIFPNPLLHITLFDISRPDYYIVRAKPCLDFLMKYTLFSKRKKRTFLRISPTFRYNYIPNISVSVYDNSWDRVSKINAYNKHLILFGLSFELMNFYKKQKSSQSN